MTDSPVSPALGSHIPSGGRSLGTWETAAATVLDEVAWVVFNRPEKRNCMNPRMNEEMSEILDTVALDQEPRVMVLTGAGAAWSAGMDLKEFFREGDALSPAARDIAQRTAVEWQGPRLREFRLPTIAMVNGYCFGGAFVPLVSCDLAIAAEDAVFGLSEVNWGIAPAGNVPMALLQTMGIRDAMYYTITAETFDGRKASQMGLVNEAVPSERLQARVLEIADVLKAKNLAVVRHAKEMLRYLRTMGFAEAQQYIDAKGRVGVVTDPERGREQGLKQFLDNKSYKPGFEAYTRG